MTTTEIENYYYKAEMPKIRKQLAEFKEEIGIWGKADRWKYLLGQLIDIDDQIAWIHLDYKKAMKSDSPYFERGLTAARLKVLVPEREKVMREMTSIERIFEGKGGKSEITEDMIERARAHPIEDLIELRRKTALCPFHPDRNPSMGIKNNRFNCFACGAKGDVIEFMMRRDCISFIEAVKSLS